MFSKKKSVVEIFHSFRIINFELNVEELDEFQILPPTGKKITKQFFLKNYHFWERA
jgi:hypothetical protein